MNGRGGVVLLHGHGRFGASMLRLAKAAKQAGYTTSSPTYPYRRSLGEVVNWLAPRIAAFEAGLDGPLHFITHSFGGLVARALITHQRPALLGRAVMLAPPNGGSELADLLFRLRVAGPALGRSGHALRTVRSTQEAALLGHVDYAVGIIAGIRPIVPMPFLPLPNPHDGKVSVAATNVEGQSDHLVLPVTHTFMVYDRRVIAATLRFLATSAFAGASAPSASP